MRNDDTGAPQESVYQYLNLALHDDDESIRVKSDMNREEIRVFIVHLTMCEALGDLYSSQRGDFGL